MGSSIRIILLATLILPLTSYGESLRLVCRGEGPSLATAREDAQRECLSTVTSRLNASVDMRSIMIEDEKSVAYHSVLVREGAYEGLNCPKPENEKITETADQVKVEFTCDFALSGVRRIEKPSPRFPASTSKRIVSIAVVPTWCSSLLVRGLNSRVVPCNSNPLRFQVLPGDLEVTIRADKHLPKTIAVQELEDANTVSLDPAR